MSTENNSDKLYNDSIKILSDLIGFKTISGEDNKIGRAHVRTPVTA